MGIKQDVLQMIHIVKGSIVTVEADAIVNSTDTSFSASGGIDYAVHKAAGGKLAQTLQAEHKIKEGEAIITPAFEIKTAKKIIHTVGPKWKNGFCAEEYILATCYRNSLTLALENHCESIAFPCISVGKNGFPEKRAAEIALNTVFYKLQAMEESCLTGILFVCSSEQQEKHYKEQLIRMIIGEFLRLYSPESYHTVPSTEKYYDYMGMLAKLEWGDPGQYNVYCKNFTGSDGGKFSEESNVYNKYALSMDKWDYSTCLSYIIYLQRAAYWSGGMEAPHYDQWMNGTVRKVLMRMQMLRNESAKIMK